MSLVSAFVAILSLLSFQLDIQLPLTWKPDGQQLAFVDNTTVYIIDASTLETVATLPHNEKVWSVAWHPMEPIIAVGTSNEGIFIWNVETEQVLSQFPGHSNWVTGLIWIDNRYLISSEVTEEIVSFIWDIETSSLVQEVEIPLLLGNAYSISPDEQYLETGAHPILIYNLNTYELIDRVVVEGALNPAFHMIWITEDTVIMGDLDGFVRSININSAMLNYVVEANDYAYETLVPTPDDVLKFIFDLHYFPNSQQIMSLSGDGTIRQWDVVTGGLTGEATFNIPFKNATFNPAGDRIAYISLTRSVEIAPNPLINQPPVAVADYEIIITTTPPPASRVVETMRLDGSGSYDPDGTIVEYLWYMDGALITLPVQDTATPYADLSSVPNQFEETIFTLVVTDNEGFTSSASFTYGTDMSPQPTQDPNCYCDVWNGDVCLTWECSNTQDQ